MSIYEKVLGDSFYQLHPMLQKRYQFKQQNTFIGKGTMNHIQGGPKWLYPFFVLGTKWKLLFPEHGRDIPFTIRNTPSKDINGEEQIHWERIFYFPYKKRFFNALMSFDEERGVIKDYLGEPRLVYSDLAMRPGDNGELWIESLNQRLVLGKLEIPLPRILAGLATVKESYCEEHRSFLISVTVNNPLFGTLFAYEGEFSSDDIT